MHNKKTMVITILLLVGFIPYYSLAVYARDKISKHPTAFELLDRYAENQGKLKSFIIRTESSSMNEITDVAEDGTVSLSSTKGNWEIEFRYEDNGDDFRAYLCPRHLESASDGSLVPEDRCDIDLWDGEIYIEHSKRPTVDDSSSYISSDKQYIKNNIAIGYPGPGLFLGWLYGDVEPFDSILKQANSISVRSALERVGSEECYVIDANTKHGTYTIWLDPKHGYSIAKADIHKGPKALCFGRPLEYYIYAPTDRDISIRNVRFESKEDIWIPMETHFLIDSKGWPHEGSKRNTVQNIQQKITKLLLNPDHDTLDSFVPAIENGTSLRIVEAPGIEYKWQEGMKLIIDEWDGSIKYVPEDWSILVNVGKPLPQFQDIELRLPAEHIKYRAIILCFFDMEQRPSRSCIIRLAKNAEKLKQQGIIVVAVQASKVDKNKLNDWVKKNSIPFHFGTIEDEEEKIRFKWGVKSLPWLIMTDNKHIVLEKGFGINELEEKLIKEKKP